jgi:Bacteriophage head to tail connecting protein
MAAAAVAVDPRVPLLVSRLTELKRIRLPYESQWRDIADYIGSSRKDTLTQSEGALRSRKIYDAQARIAKERLTAQLHAGLVNPLSPWAIPGPTKEEPDDDGRAWYDKTMRRMHQYLTSTVSMFAIALAEYTSDLVDFGNAYIWLGEIKGTGPVFRATSVWACWIDVDEHGRVDTLFREYKMTARRAAAKWPTSIKLAQSAKDAPDAMVTLVHAVEPRIMLDAKLPPDAPANKPWRDITFYADGMEILGDEMGRDRFPWAVGRFYKRADEIYGYGPSDSALPDIKLANAISEALIDITDRAVRPPLVMPVGFMTRRLDRRAGAVNYYDASKAMLVNGDPIRNLEKSGDPQLGVAMLQIVHDKIDAAYFTDWMTLPDNVAETATAVNDRKDLRAAGLAHMVVRQESEALDPIAEHAFEVLQDLDWFDEEPESLAGTDMRFFYRTPLHLSLQRGEVDAVTRFVGVLQQMETLKPGAAGKSLNVDETVRFMAERVGLPLKLLAAPEAVKAKDEEEQEAAAGAQQMGDIQAGASAARDGAKI